MTDIKQKRSRRGYYKKFSYKRLYALALDFLVDRADAKDVKRFIIEYLQFVERNKHD